MKTHFVSKLSPRFVKLCANYRTMLAPLRDEYTQNVSPDSMTLSLEAAAVVCALAEARGITNILDLGSGFSSAAFRRAIKNVDIASVDTSEDWLEKTRSFLETHGMDHVGTLRTWKEQQRVPHRYQLLVHDAGDIDFRTQVLPRVWQMTRPGSYVAFDDMHVEGYVNAVRKLLHRRWIQRFNVGQLSRDSFGRHMWLIRRMA